jgi:7-carboxy-7-deazaguanine synthase
MSKPVNEIFYSIQGEGHRTGRPAVFIRFSGCNLRCPFCDTDHEAHRLMTDREIVEAAAAFPARYAVLTGGEPALYVDEALIDSLHAAGFTVAIETNGTRPLPAGIDWVTLSPKGDFCAGADVVLQRADELKVVYTGQSLDAYAQFPARYYYVQPCDEGDAQRNAANARRCVDYCLAHPQWQLSLQIHKLIGVK